VILTHQSAVFVCVLCFFRFTLLLEKSETEKAHMFLVYRPTEIVDSNLCWNKASPSRCESIKYKIEVKIAQAW